MQSFNPDIILIAGDFVDDGTSRTEMTAAVRALGKVKTKYGVYFAFGNHDKGYHDPAVRGFAGEDLAAELQKNNITILEDETQLLNNMFYITGRKDSSEILRGNPRLEMKNLIENSTNKNSSLFSTTSLTTIKIKAKPASIWYSPDIPTAASCFRSIKSANGSARMIKLTDTKNETGQTLL